MKNELDKIKKYYGEEMMHLCKRLFPTILEKKGKLFELLANNFAFSKFLYDDIVKENKINDFKDYILSFIEKDNNLTKSSKNPFTLMDEAGYILYECKNEKEVSKFIKYYESCEMICTFHERRTTDHYVFFAVKKDVDDIKRNDFKCPKRDDLYGTSVISIQFSKGNVNTLSIKNRYNHTVDNPDATFSNNLDNIIPGLTDSFQKAYNLNIFPEDHIFELDNYFKGKNGKLYKYNYEIDEIYYCPNNIIISGDMIHEYEKEKYIIADYFIIDLIHKKIELFDDYLFDDGFEINKPINKIEIANESYGKKIHFYGNDYYIFIKLNKLNQIIFYESNLKEIDDNFLYYNKTLKTFINKEVVEIGNNFLPYNNVLTNLDIPKVQNIGDDFLEQNSSLKNVNLLYLENVGNNFLKNSTFYTIDFPSLKSCKNQFLGFNNLLKEINLPNIENIQNFFLLCNTRISHINFPNLKEVGKGFMKHNNTIVDVNLPELKIIGDEFLENNNKLKTINLPSVLKIGNYFLKFNEGLENISAPNLLYIGNNFLRNNNGLLCIEFNKIEIVGYNFLCSNYNILKVIMPNLKMCGDNFLNSAFNLKEFDFSSLYETGKYFINTYSLENREKYLVKRK